MTIQIFNFLQSPSYTRKKSYSFQDLAFIGVLLSVVVLVSVANNYLNSHVIRLLHIDVKVRDISNLLKSPFWTCFVICLLMPLIEEIIFRLPLVISPVNVALSAGGISLFLLSFVTNSLSILEKGILISLSIIAVGFIAFQGVKKYEFQLKAFTSKYITAIFYISCISFGLIHITNFHFSFEIALLAPILCLSKIILGICCGYLRLSYGFSFAVGFHSVYNLVITLPMLFAIIN